jgi:DNA-binding transcriptional regulator YiaG
MKEKRVIKTYTDERFGFPVEIKNAPFREVFGEWALDLNATALRNAVLHSIALSESKLTGAQVRFIRLTLGHTMETFGKLFDVSHAAVSKWEAFAEKPTNMNKVNELLLRGHALASLPTKNVDVFGLIKDLSFTTAADTPQVDASALNLIMSDKAATGRNDHQSTCV